MKNKRKHGNIFSGERNIVFDTGLTFDRSIVPKEAFSYVNSPNVSAKGSTPRIQSTAGKNKGVVESMFALKRQNKDLRELVKEKDSELLNIKLNMNMVNINDSFEDDKTKLQNEIKNLKDQISQLQAKKVYLKIFIKHLKL